MKNRLKKVIFLSIFMSFLAHTPSYGQSKKLIDAYNQVVSTLKNYTFISENVHEVDYDEYVTKSLSIKYKYPNLIISSVEGFRSNWAWTEDNKAKPGTHTIEIPLENAKIRFGTPMYSSTSLLGISSPQGITYSVNGKKELKGEYCLFGPKLNIEKLYNELLALQAYINSEAYKGSLGYTTNSPKSNSTEAIQKTINNKYEL